MRILRNRNFILILAFLLGILLGDVAKWTEPLTLPALALALFGERASVPAAVVSAVMLVYFIWLTMVWNRHKGEN